MLFKVIAGILFGISSARIIKIDKDIRTGGPRTHSIRAFSVYQTTNTAKVSLDLEFKARNNEDNFPQTKLIVAKNGNQEKEIRLRDVDYKVTESIGQNDAGVWLLGLVNRMSHMKVHIKGQIHTEYDHGELLPGELHAFQYYQSVTVILSAVAGVWIWLMYKWRTQIVKHHHAISGVLMISIMEGICYIGHFYYINEYGVENVFLRHLSCQIEIIRMTVCRILVLAVSFGWGILFPTLNKSTLKLLGQWSIFYGVLMSICEHVFIHMMRTDNFTGLEIILPLKLVTVLLDAYIFLRILSSLDDVMNNLLQRNQHAKFNHYRSFVLLLFGLGMIACLYVFIQAFLFTGSNRWKYFEWIEFGELCIWHLVYVKVLLIIMFKWRPTKSSKFYAYCDQLSEDEVVNEMNAQMNVMHINEADLEGGITPGIIDTIKEEESQDVTAQDPEIPTITARFSVGSDFSSIPDDLSDIL